MPTLRGADLVAQALSRAGVKQLFSLSGNHIMPIFDAALDAGLSITHTRHEGAAVHMADAWGRITGQPGIALLTGGPGHANGIGALYTALASESPLVMLSGHAPLRELGKGSFQEMRQAAMAEPVVKASWTTQSVAALGEDMARALRIASSGRTGPVHLSLPFDLLEAAAGGVETPTPAAPVQPLDDASADAVLELLARAQRPLCLAGAMMSDVRSGPLRKGLADALGVPVLCMESPRGLNDPALGALADVVARADVIVLLGKQIDFTLRFAQPPAIGPACRVAVIDPEQQALQRALDLLGRERAVFSALADTVPAARRLTECVGRRRMKVDAWVREVEAAVSVRPEGRGSAASGEGGPLHPIEVGRAVQDLIDSSNEVVFISDGGEFGQWAQACVHAPTRLINGQSGSIGSAIPFAIAAKIARPDALVVAMSGDGACGFHLLEMDTAVRAGAPFVAVVGNDACWNAEYQIQLRTYGEARAHGCELLPTRYDAVAAALGAHGEFVAQARDLAPALARAASSGKPACVNVMVERLPAPTITAVRSAAGHHS